jgi:hypothetical protein
MAKAEGLFDRCSCSHQERELKIDDDKQFAFSVIVNGAEFSEREAVFL